MKKTVWLLNHYAQEPAGAGGTRHYALARHLLRYGWECILVAASTEHGTGRQRLQTGERYRHEVHDGVRFLWVRVPAYRGNGVKRVANMIAYTRAVLMPATTADLPKPDVVIGSSVHPLAAWAGERLAVRHGVPFVFEERDLWPETLIDMGKLRRLSVPARTLLALEKYLYRRASAILTPLPGAVDYMVAHGVPHERVVWIPNGVDFDAAPKTVSSGVENRECFCLMYFGSHGQANGLEPILKGFALARKKPGGERLFLRMIGDGPLKPALMSQARQGGMDSAVSFEDPVPRSQIPRLAAQADAFVVNLRDLPLYRYGISLNKLFDYMVAARPTIFAGNSLNNPIRDARAGLCVPADDVMGIANAMLQLASMPAEERAAMGERARRHVQEHYDYSQLAGRLASVLDRVVA